MLKPHFLWILFPYAIIYYGIYVLQSAWGALIGFHLVIITMILSKWRELVKLNVRPVPGNILWGVTSGGVLGGIGVWLYMISSGSTFDIKASLEALGLSGSSWSIFIFYFCMVNPWLEEVYWRFIFENSSRFPASIDFLFAGYHLIILSKFVNLVWMLFAFLVLLLASWFWRQVTSYTKSLLPALLAHMAADFSIFIVVSFYTGYLS